MEKVLIAAWGDKRDLGWELSYIDRKGDRNWIGTFANGPLQRRLLAHTAETAATQLMVDIEITGTEEQIESVRKHLRD